MPYYMCRLMLRVQMQFCLPVATNPPALLELFAFSPSIYNNMSL